MFAGQQLTYSPVIEKFRASLDGPEARPFLEVYTEAESDALNLHEGDEASVALAASIAINCTARGTEFKATLLQKGACCRARHTRFNASKKLS